MSAIITRYDVTPFQPSSRSLGLFFRPLPCPYPSDKLHTCYTERRLDSTKVLHRPSIMTQLVALTGAMVCAQHFAARLPHLKDPYRSKVELEPADQAGILGRAKKAGKNGCWI